MIRSRALLLLTLTAALIAIPNTPQSHITFQTAATGNRISTVVDPNGTLTAFNYTYSQANLYTNSTRPVPGRFPATNVTGTSFVWLSTVTQTRTNTKIPGTGFQFNVTKSGITPGKQIVNWTLTAPRFNCKSCSGVSVNFDFFGSVTRGTNASYILSLAPPNGTKTIGTQAFTVPGTFPSGISSCPEDFCVPVPANYIGYNMTLSFGFGWNSTEIPGMFADVGEIVVASIGNFIPSSGNYMQQDPLNSGLIRHTTTLSLISYNNTMTTFLQPGNISRTKQWWQIEVISIYYPAGYTIKQVSLNSTEIFPAYTPYPNEVPFEADNCVPNTGCSQSLLALNMSDFDIAVPHNSTMTIISTTPNSLSPLTTFSAGVPTQLFAPGDTISVKAVNSPAIVNASTTQKAGELSIVFSDHNRISHILSGQTFPTSTVLGGVYNLTLPADCSLCGTWSMSANFTSGFDLGIASGSFRVDQLQVVSGSFSVSGGNVGLSVLGSLTNSSNSPATTANGVIFAIDRETPTNLPITTTNSSSGGGLYVSNATLINGVLTQGQSLIMTFTINNSANQAYNASVRIEHEWAGLSPQAHGVFANFTLGVGDGLGDLPFISSPQAYQAVFSFTPNGLRLQLTSLSTLRSESVAFALGTSPVVPTEPHTGLFKIIVATKSGSSTVSTNSLVSPPYAYVPGLTFGTSRYLAYSTGFTGASFSITMTSNAVIGAKKLIVFALARDSLGTVLVNNNQNPGFSDSTILESSMDPIGQVAKGQSVTATLHLTNNSTKLTATISVDLNLQGSGSGPVASQSGVTIAPGATQSISLSFTAPSTTGQYALSFSSPEYDGGVALASQTLQVTILQSNLQILIPAAIGVVIAIIVLGIYLVRGQPKETEPEEKPKATGPKPKPSGAGNPPSKSLTRT